MIPAKFNSIDMSDLGQAMVNYALSLWDRTAAPLQPHIYIAEGDTLFALVTRPRADSAAEL